MIFLKGKNFCDLGPIPYAISEKKEILKHKARDIKNGVKFAKDRKNKKLPCLVSSHVGTIVKTGPGIDPVLQENKAVNIRLAGGRMNGLIIHPGEEFSFWKTVGSITKKKGYKDGRIIFQNKLIPGPGGGLCNLSNTVHLLVLDSPLEVTEFHTHSDALAPDGEKRVPMSAGTSVYYNYIDFRFKNNTDQDVQLCIWTKDGKLYGELRSERPFPYTFGISEEGHHFRKEGDKYFRVSRIYKDTYDKETGELIDKQLIWDNHSEVMFDYSLIPADQIRED
ncbi:MAG: VanW family protein [Ruminococcus sp.]|nr:VanW family protein [Ruminococcus sp.]MBR6968786.1 VanW family protein [Ruminococcus sp.]